MRSSKDASEFLYESSRYIAAGPAYYVLHPQKGITICLFLTYQTFKNREGIIPQTNLAE